MAQDVPEDTRRQVNPEVQILRAHRPCLQAQYGKLLQARRPSGTYRQMVFVEQAWATPVQDPRLATAVLLTGTVVLVTTIVVQAVNLISACVPLSLQLAQQVCYLRHPAYHHNQVRPAALELLQQHLDPRWRCQRR